MKKHDPQPLKEFVAHLFPRKVRAEDLRLSYTFCLGGLSLTALLVLLLSGLLLLVYYQPTPDTAFSSILYLESRVFGGRYIRSLHRLSSHVFLILIILHTLRVLLTGAYRKPRELNWLVGFGLLCLCLFEAYTGYLLPRDQLGFWAAKTGLSLLESLPFGGVLRELLAPDGIRGGLTLLRFYVVHVVLVPLCIIALTSLHFYRIRKNRGLLPYL